MIFHNYKKSLTYIKKLKKIKNYNKNSISIITQMAQQQMYSTNHNEESTEDELINDWIITPKTKKRNHLPPKQNKQMCSVNDTKDELINDWIITPQTRKGNHLPPKQNKQMCSVNDTKDESINDWIISTPNARKRNHFPPQGNQQLCSINRNEESTIDESINDWIITPKTRKINQ